MQEPRSALGRSRGRTPLVATIAIVLAIGAVLAVLYKPWNALRYGRAQPPLAALAELEPPLAARIQERVDSVRAHLYDAQAWGALAETYDVHEHFPEAITCYERARRLDPKNPRWPYLLGLVQRIGDQKAALACFERAAALAPDMAAAHFFAGHGYLQSERAADAEREFTRALQLEPEVPATLIGLAKVALSKGEPQKALDFLTRALAKNPLTEEARWLAAAAWRALGDEKQAATFAGPGDPPPKQEPYPDRLRAEQLRDEGVTLRWARERAERWLEAKNDEQAVKEVQRYLDQVPTSAAALEALGDVYMRIGKPEEALSRYQASATVDPTRASALASWGDALSRTGKPEEAVAKVRQALALDPTSVELKSNLAGLLFGSKDEAARKESLELTREVSKAQPANVIALINLAQAEGANGNVEPALAAFQRALDLSPADPGLRHEYGVLCARLGKLPEAAEAFAAVVKAAPERMEAHANLIRALTQLGRHREAAVELRAVLERSPKSVQWRAQLAWLLATSPEAEARSGKEALELSRALVQESQEKNPEMLVILGAAQAESGDFPEAQKSIDAALELLKPKPGEVVDNPNLAGVIENALGCRAAFKEGRPFRQEAH